MKTRSLLPALLGVLIATALHAQPAGTQRDTLAYAFSLEETATFATADHLSNIYVLTATNDLAKYDSTGRRVARYSNNRLGKPTALEATNPLKLLLWYADFQTVITLDRTLNEIGQLNLNEAGFPAVRCVGLAQDGNLWIYDDAGFRLLKITTSGQVLLESQPLNMVFPKRLAATWIRDNGEQVFLSDPEQGISAFDQYGFLLKTYPALKTERFELLQNWIVFADTQALHFENLSRFQSLEIPLPAAAQQEGALFWASGRYLVVQRGERLEVFVLKGL